MKSLQACTSSSNARTQWGEAECSLLWSPLARLRRSPAGIIHTRYKTRTYKNSRKNSMTQLGFRCYDFLLFMLGKGRREEISRDYIETHQRAQHSLESAQCSIDRLCFLFDFLSSYHSLYSVCFVVSRSLCQQVISSFSRHMGTTGRANKVLLLCRDMKLQIQKPFFKRVGDSIDCFSDPQFHCVSFIVS